MKKIKIDNFFGDKTQIFEDCIKEPKNGIAEYEVEDILFDRLVAICQKFCLSYSLVDEEQKSNQANDDNADVEANEGKLVVKKTKKSK